MLKALTIQELNKDVAYHFLETLFADVAEENALQILQDRQSAPRPIDEKGNLQNYIFFRVDTPRTLQQMTKEVVDENGKTYERTISQKQLRITLNFVGKNAGTLATYLDHAINANLLYTALRPVIGGRLVQFEYNNHSDPVDLTAVENAKYLARYQMELFLGYLDAQDFGIDVFDTVEITEQVECGSADGTDGTSGTITQKTIIVKPEP